MKRIWLITMLTACMALLHIDIKAENYEYMVFSKTDGTEASISTEGLRITFSNGQLVATAGTESLTLELSSLESMAFSENAATTDISTVKNYRVNISTDQRNITVAAPAGSKVTIYNVNGSKVASSVNQSGSTESVASSLSAGVYLVKVNQSTYKVLVK